MDEDSKRGGIVRGIFAGASVVTVLAAIYVGSYLALSEPYTVSQGGVGVPNILVGREQSFRFGGDAAERFFWPLTKIDAKVRPDYWVTPEYRRLVEADRAREAASSN